ncbi:MAG: methyl-accepting chemotaxis protein [Oligoflexia bacterium]|nr:methyl-accepting chemotaxis protein [Oligoflexia bacterium]
MSSLSLNARIALLIALLSVTCFALTGFALYHLSVTQNSIREITGVMIKRAENARLMNSIGREITINEKNYILEEQPENREKIAQRITDLVKEWNGLAADGYTLANQQGKEVRDRIKENFDRWLANYQRISQAARSGEIKTAITLSRDTGAALRRSIENDYDWLIRYNAEKIDNAIREEAEDFESARFWIILMSVIGIGSTSLFAAAVLKKLNTNIGQVIADLGRSSDSVSSASFEIASASTELSSQATKQAASLEETTAAITQISSTIQQNAANAQQAAKLTAVSQSSSLKGKAVVKDLLEAIGQITRSNEEIGRQIQQSNTRMNEIVGVIHEIGGKTKVINDIVFQTKLLSFNASVEAARAGEHGKGFAVVAEEVGNLARMSGSAAKEIGTLLDASVKKVETIANDTQSQVSRLLGDADQKLAAGARVAQECEVVLNEINTQVTEVSQMAGDIARASEEQAQGAHQITETVNSLNSGTQQGAAATEQAARSAEALTAQASSMNQTVSQLVAIIKGRREDRGTARAPVINLRPQERSKALAPDLRVPAHEDLRFGT